MGLCPTSASGTRRSTCTRATSSTSSLRIAFQSGEDAPQVAGRDRTAHQEPLRLVAEVRAQEAQLLVGLHALGYDLQTKVVAEGDDRSHDRRVIRIARDVLDER